MTWFARILWLLPLALAASSCVSRPAAAAAPPTIRLVAAGPGGDDFLARYRKALPGVHISSDGNRGSSYVVSALQQGRADIGFAQADVVYLAYRAGLRGASQTHTGLRGIAVRESANVYLVVRRDSPSKTIADLRRRRIGVAEAGMHAEFYTRMIFSAYGLDGTTVEFKPYDNDEMAAHLRDGTLAAAAFGGRAIPRVMADLNGSIGLRLLGLSGDAIVKLRSYYPFFSRVIVTASQLPGQHGDVQTVGVDNLLICREDLSNDQVYQLTRAFFEASSSGGTAFPSFLPADRNRAAATPIPLHPGAARYYRERELLQ